MTRRGNPYDNAMMESFMKTLKVEGVYPMAFESAEDVACHLPRFIDSYISLPQQADDLLRLVTLPRHRRSSSFHNLRMDQFHEGGSA